MWSNIKKEVDIYGASLVVVSKTREIPDIKKIYDLGQRDFGENRVQELEGKKHLLPTDIRWHLIGHLQSNKVKYIVPYVHMIHSVDSIKLLKTIEVEAGKINRIVDILLQFHVAQESSKFGFNENNIDELQALFLNETLSHVRIRGIMGMASFTDDLEQVSKEFRQLRNIFEQFKRPTFMFFESFDTLSMGMSSDYRIALEEGSNLVTVGSAVFT